MLYLHGGLNDEAGVAKRVVAYRDVFLANEIYPLHVMAVACTHRSNRIAGYKAA